MEVDFIQSTQPFQALQTSQPEIAASGSELVPVLIDTKVELAKTLKSQ